VRTTAAADCVQVDTPAAVVLRKRCPTVVVVGLTRIEGQVVGRGEMKRHLYYYTYYQSPLQPATAFAPLVNKLHCINDE